MYAILNWVTPDFVTFISNRDGSIMLFDYVSTADAYIEYNIKYPDNLKVISVEGVVL